MMKIDRIPYANHPCVQKLVNANLTWDGEGEFKWRVTIEGRGFDIREKIFPVLVAMTKKHCAFCDFYPLSKELFNPLPIEHFYPKCKGKYPEKAYLWENLFPSCYGCTDKKKNRFDEKLLKPDEDVYYFDTYFSVTGDGKIEPSLHADENIKTRAKVTIDIYKLNDRGDLLSLRKRHFRDYQKLAPITDIDERPFRFLIPIAEKAVIPDSIINEFIHD